MPIYEYRCKTCKIKFECLVLGSDSSISCPECTDENIERLMSAYSFKSSGNYAPSSGSTECSTCSSKNCSSCH